MKQIIIEKMEKAFQIFFFNFSSFLIKKNIENFQQFTEILIFYHVYFLGCC